MSNPVQSPLVELHEMANNVDDINLEEGAIFRNREKCKKTQQLLEETFLFESLSVQFHVFIFLRQFLSHMIVPFCFLLVNYRGQGFIRPLTNYANIFQIYVNLIFPVLVYVMIITYFLMTPSSQEVLYGAFWMPLIYFIQHKLVVSLKYATLSPKEYNKIQNCKSNEQCDIYQSQMQLLSSWYNRDQKVLEFEIASAAVRIGAKINEIFYNIQRVENYSHGLVGETHTMSEDGGDINMHSVMETMENTTVENILLENFGNPTKPPRRISFTIDDTAAAADIITDTIEKDTLKLETNPEYLDSLRSNFYNWNAFIRGYERIDTSVKPAREFVLNNFNNFSISVYDVSCAIVRQADGSEKNKFIVNYIIFYACLLTAVIPYIHLALTTKQFTMDIYAVLFLATSSFISFTFGRVAYIILSTAIWDVFRQVSMVKTLHVMLRLSDLMLDNECSFGSKAKEDDDEGQVSNIAIIMSIAAPSATVMRRRTTMARNGLFAGIPVSTETCGGGDVSSSGTNSTESTSSTSATATTTPKRGIARQRSIHPTTTNTTARLSIFGESIAMNNSRARIPRIDFDCPNNVIGWTYTRLVIQNFGERYRFRIDVYTAGSVFLMVILMALSLLDIIMTKNKKAVFESVMFQQAMIAVVMIMCFLITVTYAGAQVNAELSLHSRTLSEHQLRVRRKLILKKRAACMCDDDPNESQEAKENREKDIEILELISDNIDSTMGCVDIHTELKPFRVFGMVADNSITMSVITSGISFFGVLLSLYSQQDASTVSSVGLP